MRKIIKYIVILSMCMYSVVANGQTIKEDPNLRKGVLKNGLSYYILSNHRSGQVADFYLVQKTGSLVETENQRGIAHFLEHMAFKGTRNFPGKSLIDKLGKLGINFGADINAHTSYGETIYRLTDVPLGAKGIVDTALLVLHDWSRFILNNDKDIEKERDVVHEEWRTSNTAAKRTLEETIYPSIFEGSPYSNRMPIGKLSVIDNFKPEELRDYYHKWYRPDLQAVVVVGAIDVDKVEAQILNMFKGIPIAIAPVLYPKFTPIQNKKSVVVIATDKELSNISIDLHLRLKDCSYGKVTKAYYKSLMIDKMMSNLIINRFVNLSQKNKKPFGGINATIGSFLVAENNKALSFNITSVGRDSIVSALKFVLTELQRLKRFGFTESELSNYRSGALNLIEREYLNRNKRDNADYAKELIKMITKNEAFPSAEWSYQNSKQILSELSLDSLNQVAQDLISNPNLFFVFTAPSKEKEYLPDSNQVLNLWAKIQKANLLPYESSLESKSVLPKLSPVGGRVSKTENQLFGFTQWVLANGARVQFKQTDNQDDNFYIWAYSPGGRSLLSEADLPSAIAMNHIINKGGVIDPDGKASITFNVNEYDEIIGGKTNDLKEIENLFKLLYIKMTDLKIEPRIFDEYIELKKNEIANLNQNPKDIFNDTLNSVIDNHRAMITLNNLNAINKVDYDRVIRIYKDRFGNAGDFSFFITGNVNSEIVRGLVEKYIGSLPYSKIRERSLDNGIGAPPKGIIKRHFNVAMKIPQSTVTICYTGALSLSVENQLLMDCLSGILEITCKEKMRNKEGGTYSIWVGSDIAKVPTSRFVFQLIFDANPEKRDKLLKLVYEEINKIMKNGPDSSDIQKVKQNLLKINRQNSSIKDSYYWLNKAWMHHVQGLDGRVDYEKALSLINSKKIQIFAKKLFQQGNLIEVIMNPKL